MPIVEVGTAKFHNGFIICWRIPSSSLLPQKEGIKICSSAICVSDAWMLRSDWHSEIPMGSIGLLVYFEKVYSEALFKKCFRFGVVSNTGNVLCSCLGEWDEGKRGFKVKDLFQKHSWIKHTERKHIFCEVISDKNYQAMASTITDNACSSATKEEKGETPSKHSNNKADENRNQDIKNLEKLSENFKELYISGENSDLTIHVKDHQFKAHKAILISRSSVFKAMFSHALSESNTSMIPIEDCEPAIFEEFLFFVYSGRTRQLSSDNACDLYYVADKYLIPELKEECISFLKKSLSVDTICEVICLSTKCNETDLLDRAVKFFASNMEIIILTVKWQLFMKENPTEANELIVKALKLGFTKKKN